MAKTSELTFQQHIADFLVREHGYGVLEQADITDPDEEVSAATAAPPSPDSSGCRGRTGA